MPDFDQTSIRPSDQPGPAATPPALDQLFDVDSLYALRSAVAAHGAELGLVDHGLADLILVAHELATNAIRHGGATAASPGRLRLWVADGVVVCEVHDSGPGLSESAAIATGPVAVTASNGRGLWIIRQLAELEISSSPTGTIMTARLPRPE